MQNEKACHYAPTCMWSANCRGTCWFARGERDLGDMPRNDPDVEFVKHFLTEYHKKTGCSYRELEKITGLSRTWIGKLMSDEVDSISAYRAVDTRYKITRFALERIREGKRALA